MARSKNFDKRLEDFRDELGQIVADDLAAMLNKHFPPAERPTMTEKDVTMLFFLATGTLFQVGCRSLEQSGGTMLTRVDESLLCQELLGLVVVRLEQEEKKGKK